MRESLLIDQVLVMGYQTVLRLRSYRGGRIMRGKSIRAEAIEEVCEGIETSA